MACGDSSHISMSVWLLSGLSSQHLLNQIKSAAGDQLQRDTVAIFHIFFPQQTLISSVIGKSENNLFGTQSSV